MSDDEYGPPLPPGFHQPVAADSDSSSCDANIGPALPPSVIKDSSISNSSRPADGQSLPSGSNSKLKGNNSGDDYGHIGPALPHGWKKCGDEKGPGPPAIGPQLPPGFAAPVGSDSDSDSDDIGPMPSERMTEQEAGITAYEFEKRAQKMKDKLTGKGESDIAPERRDSWMTELPPDTGQVFGLTSRTFRVHGQATPTGDRSVWTDTPADRERKQNEKEEGRDRKRHHGEDKHKKHKHKDRKLTKEIEKHNKSKRAESLMEMHQEKRKKEKKKEKKEKSRPKERQAFDREKDLQVNKFDDAQTQKLIKRSQQLNSRFGHGGVESSFL